MKKSILALGFLCAISMPVAVQSESFFGDIFNKSVDYLKDNGMDLLKKGGQYLWDNSDKIFSTVKENAGPLFDQAKNLVFGEAKKEADKEEQVIVTKAKEIIAINKEQLTPIQQQTILKEAQNIATQNRAELHKIATESIEQKRQALKSSIYEKYGKGTPIK